DRITTSVAGTFGGKAVDKAVLARLPATTLMTLAFGCDGKGYWKAAGNALLSNIDSAMHRGAPVGAEATATEIRTIMQAMGIEGGLQQVIESIDGTIVVALTQGAPVPGMTIALPRAKAIDQLVGIGLAQAQVEMPAEGQSAMMPLPPGVPVALSLLRDKTHWVLSTDPMLLATWPSGAPGGFADTAMAKTLYTKAPANAYLLGASDTPTVIRTIQGYVGMAMGMARDLSAQQKQAINAAMTKLASNAATGYLFATQDDKGGRLELRGLFGGAVFPAIIAAIAVPNLMESRVTANESATAATLKSGVFPAQITFQAGGYQDADADNVGEHGLLSELTGLRATNKIAAGSIKLLQGPLAQANGGFVANGYHYMIYLPDGKGGAIGEPAGDQTMARPSIIDGTTVKDANDQEMYWVAYAWPVSRDTGRRMFVMLNDGQVRSEYWNGQEPKWNDVFGGGTWTDQATTPIYSGSSRSSRQNRRDMGPPPEAAPVGEKPLF
ncbi:MAG: hypothetical protein AAB263_00255, partial [Planctomycetota bacterium]